MMSVSRKSVLAAIAEFDRAGRDAFLAWHGFRKSRYLLVYAGREYDSKAIFGVAVGYEQGETGETLPPSRFSGGVAHVKRWLARLGFAFRDARCWVVGLVSCSKAKLDTPAPARLLYSPSYVFARSVRWLEARCDEWFVLSAKHGLVEPDTVLAPYDETLAGASKQVRARWADRIREALRQRFAGRRVTYLLLAGSNYAFAVAGFEVEQPLKGMSTGARRRWLAQNT